MERVVYYSLVAGVALIATGVQWAINSVVKERYIDEIFHIKMTEQYLVRREFSEWDPKITTPPGLYLAGMVFGEVAKLFLGQDYFN
jgi:alpha-1,2-glucosyltransferase